MVEGQMSERCLVCSHVFSNMTVACPAFLIPVLRIQLTGIAAKVNSERTGLIFDRHGQPLVICISVLLLRPGIIIQGLASYSLSILGGVFILLTFSLFKELRTFTGFILMNLSITIIVLNVCNIALYLGGNKSIIGFKVLVSFQVYHVSSEFLWMTLLLVEMTRSLYQAWRLTRPSHSKWRFILVYMLIGWGLPLMSPLLVFDNNVSVLVWVFLLLLAVVNLCLLVIATVFLCLFSRHRRRVSTHITKRNTPRIIHDHQ